MKYYQDHKADELIVYQVDEFIMSIKRMSSIKTHKRDKLKSIKGTGSMNEIHYLTKWTKSLKLTAS